MKDIFTAKAARYLTKQEYLNLFTWQQKNFVFWVKYISIYLASYLPTYLPTYQPIYLSIYLSIYIYLYLSIYLKNFINKRFYVQKLEITKSLHKN